MTASRGFVRVLPSDDLSAGEGLDTRVRAVQVAGRTLLVGRMADGQVVAFGPACPHEGADLRRATFVDGCLRCPRHNYMYDPTSGENLVPGRETTDENRWKLHPGYLPTHAVEEHEGWVWISEAPRPPPPGWDASLEEPPPGATRQVPREPAEPPAHETVEVPVKHLRVAVGAEFELRLPLGAPAHTWTVEAPAELMVIVSQSLEPSTPPRQRVRISARQAGRATVRCTFGRPWEDDPAEVRTYQVEVVGG